MIAHINIGSNQGNRKENIDRAVTLLSNAGMISAISAPVNSAPWGFDSDSDFLNVGVNLETRLTAMELLSELKCIEHEISPNGKHRTENGDYADREIDLDLIAYGNEIVESENLTLPHPRMTQRRFVLEPMASLMPEWRHPGNGMTCEEMLQKIQ